MMVYKATMTNDAGTDNTRDMLVQTTTKAMMV